MSPARRADTVGLLASLLLHAGVAGYVLWRTSTPDLGFEFELPMEVELGLTDAVTVSAGAAPAATEPPPSESAAAAEHGPGAAPDAGVPEPDAGPPDAGRRRRERDAGPPQLAEGDEGEGLGDEGEGAGDRGQGRGVAFLPAGSQIALRLDVARVRASPLAGDVREVLRAMPDWQALIGASGIEPLDDMDRLLVASPNLERSRLVAAGRASGGEEAIRAAAERLAAGQGAPLEWRTVRGAAVADWHDGDETARVVALIGPRHFVIARPEDLPRVIAVARARAARDAEEEAAQEEHPADALLSMQDGEGLSLEVEGFRNYARARPGRRSPLERLPLRLHLGLSELADGRIGARIEGRFEDAEQARGAVGYWDEARQAYARNIVTAVLGLSPILSRLELRADEEVLRASVDIEVAEMRRLLGLVRGFFEDRARPSPPGALPPPPMGLPPTDLPPGAPPPAAPAPPAPPPSPY